MSLTTKMIGVRLTEEELKELEIWRRDNPHKKISVLLRDFLLKIIKG